MIVLGGIFDSPAELGIIFLAWVPSMLIGYLIGRAKGQAVLGLVLGGLLGCLGWVIVALLPAKQQPLSPGGTPFGATPVPRPTPGATPTTPQWAADPFGRFEQRYHDGTKWTEHVSTQGRQYTDDPSH